MEQPAENTAALDITGRRLMEAAGRILASDGPAALTVRRVSSEAGCSTMCLYDRFGDKSGVVDRLFIDGFASLEAATVAALAGDDPLGCIRASCGAFRTWALDNRTHYAVMFARAVPDYTPSPAAIDNAKRALRTMERGIQAAIDAGSLAARPACDLAHVIWAALHGLVSLELAGMLSAEAAGRYHQQVVDALLRGLAPE
ncbi:MAG TPA: TetR/AcrR family transcriptional regulator [Acidimicrobiales bacterium]